MESLGMKRGITFGKAETALLVELVLEHKDLIESRSTDGTTNKMKTETWNDIEDKFNSKDLGIARSAHQLKLKYVDMKRQLRKKVADYRRRMAKANPNKPPILLLNADESVIYSWLHPSTMGLQDSSYNEPITFEVVEDIIYQKSAHEDGNSNQSMGSKIDEHDITIEEPKLEPEDCDESFSEEFFEELEHPLRKRKLSNDEEAKVLEFYKKKECSEDKEHKLLIHKYEMEVAMLKKKLKESELDDASRYEREMLAYYKRKEAKEDKEHTLLVQKYELEIALLQKNLAEKKTY